VLDQAVLIADHSSVTGGFRQEVRRVQVRQPIKHEQKFIARVLGVKRRKIIAFAPTGDGFGWAVYYLPSIAKSKVAWLILVTAGGVWVGDHVEFANTLDATIDFIHGGWHQHVANVYAKLAAADELDLS
jgi:hypothetical protein